MSYSIDVDPPAQAVIASMPHAALAGLAEALAVLELTPWNGDPVNPELTPDGPLRNLAFGSAGMITYLIVEHDHRVDVLLITWGA